MAGMQNYEIIRKLGAGSYGSVYLARQKDSGKQCVMKRMVLRQLNEKERQSAFQEAQVLRSLSHPNIVAYIDTQATASKLRELAVEVPLDPMPRRPPEQHLPHAGRERPVDLV